jgi:hypothetical protein
MSDQLSVQVEAARLGMAPPPTEVSQLVGVAEALSGMIEALADEVQAIRQDLRHSPIPLSGGERIEADAFGATYRFHAAGRPRVRVGAEVAIRIANDTWPGTIARRTRRLNDGHEIIIRLSRDFGPHAPAGELLSDTSWMKARLAEHLGQPEPGSNSLLAAAAIGLVRTPPLLDTPATRNTILEGELSEDQQRAVALSLALPVAHVWGPPGTGKTRTMAHCAAEHAAAGRIVLVAAPSNAAADTAALQLASLLQDHPRFDQGILLRIGSVESPELRARYGDCVELPRVAERLAGTFGDPRAVARRLLADCQIVVTTIQRTYLMRALATMHFDVLLLDEAAMCILPDAFAAARLAANRVTFFGDFRQLPAVVTANTMAAHQWLRRDPFEAHGLAEAVLEDRPAPGMVMLREQRRMAEPICRLVSEGWYGGALTTHRSVRERSTRFSDRWNTVTLLDTSRLRPQTIMNGRERSNPVHAAVLGALLDELIDYGDLAPQSADSPSVMLLTPYCGQADLLYQEGRLRRLGRGARASTVHGAQGCEAEAVVLDLADASGAKLSGFLRARRFDDVGARLLNVALSRSRQRLFVIADCEFLLRHAPKDGAVHLLLSLLEEQGALEDAADLMRNRRHERIAG